LNGRQFINDCSYFYLKNSIKHLIVIEGPTASGKTSISVALAKHYNTCVLSADSRQFYRELSIGTAKPSSTEQKGVKHYFINSHSIKDEVSSAQYEKEAMSVLEEEFKANDIIIVTGGSGMFIDALCIGLDGIPASDELRSAINKEYKEKGLAPLLDELKKNDATYFSEIDRSNPMRVIRAIEVIRLTGKPYSKQRGMLVKKRPFTIHRFVIHHDREKLYARINTRVDKMMDRGLLQEVKSVMASRELVSLNTVGYKELFRYLDGKYSLEEAVAAIKQNTRRYSKRQLTWFRRHPEAIWIDYQNDSQMVRSIIEKLKSIAVV
jgi:tRNA dimethylallyltransferase